MGAFIARQPNGLLCRFSTVVDTVTDWNMTDDEYVLMHGRNVEDAIDTLEHHMQPFSEVKTQFQPNNMTNCEFENLLKEMEKPVRKPYRSRRKPSGMKILDLVVRREWFRMYVEGIKKEEYREINPYWTKRFTGYEELLFSYREGYSRIGEKYTHVRIRDGYSTTALLYELEKIVIGIGNRKWGAPMDTPVYILKLGEKIEI